jgi:hypothetical protein
VSRGVKAVPVPQPACVPSLQERSCCPCDIGVPSGQAMMVNEGKRLSMMMMFCHGSRSRKLEARCIILAGLQPCPWPTALALRTGSTSSVGSCQTLFEKLGRVFNWPAGASDVDEVEDIKGRTSETMSIDVPESLQPTNG